MLMEQIFKKSYIPLTALAQYIVHCNPAMATYSVDIFIFTQKMLLPVNIFLHSIYFEKIKALLRVKTLEILSLISNVFTTLLFFGILFQVYFKCNGVKTQALNFEFVDPQTGVRIIEGEYKVTRELVEEYFGSDKYQCSCFAWTSRGQIRSQPATIELACKSTLSMFLI